MCIRDSYGSAITSMPQLEAVPHELVFMRSKLFGSGPRDSQTYSFVSLPNSPFIIEKMKEEGSIASEESVITANLNPPQPNATYSFRILDGRGLIINNDPSLTPDFSYPDVTPVTVNGADRLIISAKDGQITSDKSVGLEVFRDGSAPAMTTILIKQNSTAG